MSNTELWDKLKRVPKEHLKGFKRAGGFTGTAIKPMWTFHRMTEEFGPCGIGWGVNEPHFQTIPGHNGEIMVYCTVSVWHSDKANTVFGVGGDRIVTYVKPNEQYHRPERWDNDDEAFKKAFTDAVTNALKMVGAGADVHMGLFDGSKYVDEKPAKKIDLSVDEPDNRGEGEPFNEIDGVDGRPRYKGGSNKAPDEYLFIQSAIRAQRSVDDLMAWGENPTNKEAISKLPAQWIPHIRNEFKDRLDTLRDAA